MGYSRRRRASTTAAFPSRTVASRGTFADWGTISKRRMNPYVTVDALHVLRAAGRM